MGLKRLTHRTAWLLAAVGGAVLVAKFFVADVYRVRSGSMKPGLWPGDFVLVRYARAPKLERFDYVVVERPGLAEPVVKRAIGLPNETVQLNGGDLLVDGARLGPDVERPEPVLMFRGRGAKLEELFRVEGPPDAELGPWRLANDVWVFDGRGRVGKQPALVARERLLDGFFQESPDGGEHVYGSAEVPDAILEVQVAAEASGGALELRLSEEADVFALQLGFGSDGTSTLTLDHRRVGEDTLVERFVAQVPLELGTWHQLRLSNLDNVVSVHWNGEPVLERYEYGANQPYPRGAEFRVLPGGRRSAQPRFSLGARDAYFRLGDVQLQRDLSWSSAGDFAVRAPLTLGPSEFFLLGDNSSDSEDSRFWGQIHEREVLGLPLAIVWPPSRWRWLNGVETPR